MEKLKGESYSSIDKKVYTRILNDIKKQYGTLIIKVTGELDNIKNLSSNDNGTSVCENDKDDDGIITKEMYEELENNEMGIKNSESDEVKKEIRRLRDLLMGLCYSVIDMIGSLEDNSNIDKKHLIDLREYIDDTILWVSVKEQISVEDYKEKTNILFLDIDMLNLNDLDFRKKTLNVPVCVYFTAYPELTVFLFYVFL